MHLRSKRIVLIPILLGFLVAQVVHAATSPPGTENNPVVAKSYVEKVLQPMRNQISALQTEIAQLKTQRGSGFADLPANHWAYDSIMYMVNKKIVKGVTANSFGPDMATTRAQLAVMLVNALNLPTAGNKVQFKDVPQDYWASSYIATAQKAGIIQGSDGKFRPNDSVTRGEMAAMLVRAFKFERLSKAADFKDVSKDYWAYDQIMRIADNRITKGYADQTFRPANKLKRAEVCVFITLSLEPSKRPSK